MPLLKQYLDCIPDHRRAQGRMYDLPHLLLFCILALTAEAKSYRQLHQFIGSASAEAAGRIWLSLAAGAGVHSDSLCPAASGRADGQ